MADRQLTVIDLFCGAGGFSLGFQAAGCRILAAVDVDPVAAETYRTNFSGLQPDAPPRVFAGEEGDLDRLAPDVILPDGTPDIVIGGPPCQAFSRLGRAKLDSLSAAGFRGDPRNVLYRQFLLATERWRPLAVVMENVPGMFTVGGENYADIVTGELAEIGYRAGYALLNAVWFGVPQFRERLFFIGIRDDLGRSPSAAPTTHRIELPDGYSRPLRSAAPTLSFGGLWDRIQGQLAVPASAQEMPAVTVQDALADLPALDRHLVERRRPRGEFRQHMSYRSPPQHDYVQLIRSWPGFPTPDGVIDHVVRRTPRDYETFRRMRPGDRYPEALVIARSILDEEVHRLRAAGRAPTPGTPAWDELVERFVPPYDETEFPDKWRKLIPDRPSWTVPAHLAKDSYSHIHYDNEQARMISVREAARLQSFPDGFTFCGNMGDCFRQIGNAVPALVARAVAESVLVDLGQSRR